MTSSACRAPRRKRRSRRRSASSPRATIPIAIPTIPRPRTSSPKPTPPMKSPAMRRSAPSSTAARSAPTASLASRAPRASAAAGPAPVRASRVSTSNSGGGSPFGRRRATRGAGEDDIFSHLFGEAFRTAERGGRARAAPPGEDVAALLTVTVEDIANEATKRIALPTGREVDVTIPKGVTDGQTIRLRGLGQGGPGGAGDALL